MFFKSLLAGGVIAAGGVGLLAAQQSSTPGNTQRDAAGQTPSEQSPSGQPTSGQVPAGQTQIESTNPSGGRSSQMGHGVAQYITDCLVSGNQAEIALARIAQERATDPEVKQFARKMIQDHTAFSQKLQTARGTAGRRQSGDQSAVESRSALGGEANRDQSNRDQSNRDQSNRDQSNREQPNAGQANGAQTNGDQPGVGSPGVDINAAGAQVRVRRGDTLNTTGAVGQDGRSQAGGARQFVQMQKEVAAQCLQSMTRELSQKEGAQFDRCYMNSQVVAHMMMADELTVYSKHVSDNLQSTLQEGLQTTRQHLATAKQIAERLEGSNPRSAVRNQNSQAQ